MKRNRVRIFIGVLGIAIVAGLVWFWFARHGAGAKGRLVLYGNVDIRQVQLAFNDSERFTALLVREGDRVHAGQLVATLETHRRSGDLHVDHHSNSVTGINRRSNAIPDDNTEQSVDPGPR